jgi:hypothetical protein
MNQQVFVNHFSTTLAADINSTVTALQLTSATGAPTIANGDWWMLHLVDTDGAKEIVKVTARTGVNCTIVRAQEGTTNVSHTLTPVTVVQSRLTAESTQDFEDAKRQISDLDGDTKIQVEESDDEDVIRLDVAGSEIAKVNSTGIVLSQGKAITDSDGDTKIQLEEGADDDTIRFDAAGSEKAIIDSAGMKVNSNRVIEGAAIATPIVQRTISVYIQNGVGAATLKCTVIPQFNGDSIATSGDIAVGGDDGHYTLITDDILSIAYAGLSGKVLGVLSTNVYSNCGTNLDCDASDVGDDLQINFYAPGDASGSTIDLTTLVDTGTITVLITYITDA